MLLMEYQSIIGEDLPDNSEKDTWNIFCAYVDAHNQILFVEYPVDGVQDKITLQMQ